MNEDKTQLTGRKYNNFHHWIEMSGKSINLICHKTNLSRKRLSDIRYERGTPPAEDELQAIEVFTQESREFLFSKEWTNERMPMVTVENMKDIYSTQNVIAMLEAGKTVNNNFAIIQMQEKEKRILAPTPEKLDAVFLDIVTQKTFGKLPAGMILTRIRDYFLSCIAMETNPDSGDTREVYNEPPTVSGLAISLGLSYPQLKKIMKTDKIIGFDNAVWTSEERTYIMNALRAAKAYIIQFLEESAVNKANANIKHLLKALGVTEENDEQVVANEEHAEMTKAEIMERYVIG